MVTATKGKTLLPLAAYLRVSDSGDKGEDLRSPELQLNKIKRNAEPEGIALVEYPADKDVSGGKAKRKNLDRIIEDIRLGKIGGIYVSKLDRLSRLTPKDRVELFEIIETELGGRILSASENLDVSTPEGRFAREVFLGIARMQWEKYREDWAEIQASQIRNGWSVVKPGIGYLKLGKRQPFRPDPKTAPTIAKLITKRSTGIGWGTLVNWMQSTGIKTAKGNDWTVRSIQNIVHNEIYIGRLRFGDLYNESAHEPLVDLATWTLAQNPHGSQLRPVSATPYLLSGLVRCSECRYCMSGNKKKSTGTKRYRCHQPGCPNQWKSVNAKQIERALTFPEIPALSTATFWADGKGPRKTDTSPFEVAYEVAKSLEDQASTTEAQMAFGDKWLDVVQERKKATQEALEALAAAQSDNMIEEEVDSSWTTEEFRAALGRVIDCISVRADGTIVVYPKGTGPRDLPRPGQRRVIKPFGNSPRQARTITLVPRMPVIPDNLFDGQIRKFEQGTDFSGFPGSVDRAIRKAAKTQGHDVQIRRSGNDLVVRALVPA
jgi:DNA invertase Pin-like site-specific DNA recombinase